MRMQLSFAPEEILEILQPRTTRGRSDTRILGIAGLDCARAGDLSFLGNQKYRSQVSVTQASLVLVPEDFEGEPGENQIYALVSNPSAALGQICARIEQQLWPKPASGIHASAVVEEGADIASTATIGPQCVVESGAVIGENVHLQAQVFVGRNARVGSESWLMPGVVVGAECEIGRRVRLHSGVVVGSDGFGYEFVDGRHEKVPQVGSILIEDDVEIGANSTIDRARFSRTIIGEGTKIDNLVQIAHNVIIGKHCILCAQVGISGSAVLGDYVILGGQAGVAGHIKLGKGVKSGGRAGITSDVEAGAFVNGYPAIPYMQERRIQVLQRKLPELFKRVSAIEEKD